MTDEFLPQKTSSDLMSVEQHRAVQEVQAAMIIAKRFPRDVDDCLLRIKKACKRVNLAEKASYVYPRGGTSITGPSIRLAEVIGQNWTNLVFGIRELSQSEGKSEIESFAWDLETNVRQVKTFTVKHERKAHGKISALDDPRDIYEHTANLGARRLRACILGIIPVDVTDAAEKQCLETLKNRSDKPLEDRIRDMLDLFVELGVTKAMIELRVGHKTSTIIEQELVNLRQIYNSLKDGMAKREDWFRIDADPKVDTDLKEAILTKAPEVAEQETEPDTEKPAEIYKEGSCEGIKDATKVDNIDPWARANWINLRSTGFPTHVWSNIDSLKTQPKEIITEVRKKWVDDLKLGEKFPLDIPPTNEQPKVEKFSIEVDEDPEPELSETTVTDDGAVIYKETANNTESQKTAIVDEIVMHWSADEIKEAQRKMNFAVGRWPTTLDGCQALYKRLKENEKM